MSHFAVLVVLEDVLDKPKEIQSILEREMAPFQENNMGDCPKEYLKFNDEEDEMLKQYEEESREMIVMPDGRLLLPWDEEFRKKPNPKSKDIAEVIGTKAEPPKHLKRRMVPYKETFSTFEEYAEKWHGRKERDETYNRYGYWENPNAKWDWYEIGGRWGGFFKLKKGCVGGLGKQYNWTGRLDPSNDRADLCFKKEVDFEFMRNEMGETAAKRYDAVCKAIGGTPPNDSWEIVKDRLEVQKHRELIDEARKQYHAQPRVKAFTKFGISEEGREMVGFFSSVEDYDVSREQYIQTARNHAAVPFAVLRDGKWFEQGEMGWWGMASNEKDPETWNSMVNKLYDELPETALLIAVDCHI